jgi:hypothetical protein
MSNEPQPPGGYPIAVKYIISYHIISYYPDCIYEIRTYVMSDVNGFVKANVVATDTQGVATTQTHKV